MAERERQMVDLVIAGQTYRIASRYDASYMETIAARLNRKLEEIRRGATLKSTPHALILAALDLIDEQTQLLERWRQERSILSGAIESLLGDVDREVRRCQKASEADPADPPQGRLI